VSSSVLLCAVRSMASWLAHHIFQESRGCAHSSAINYVYTHFFLIRVDIRCYINSVQGV
jgi:hypothetical protein